jgi:methyl halide transferase
MKLNAAYWSDRYRNRDTGWDIGYISTPLKAYFDQLADTSLRILLPGGGNSYEAEYLHTRGFTQVFLLDYAQEALDNFQARVPGFPEAHLIKEDFFHHRGTYDRIIEQTFFCALAPSLRSAYAKKCHDLLARGGKLAGLLFDDPLNADRPPFGGTREEYMEYFRPYFDIQQMEKAYNSIPPRAGRELFIKIEKK